MIGRGTRRCDEIGKTVFCIYDPVDLYAALEDVNTMKPLVKDPNITIEQLVGELTDPEHLERALKAPAVGALAPGSRRSVGERVAPLTGTRPTRQEAARGRRRRLFHRR